MASLEQLGRTLPFPTEQDYVNYFEDWERARMEEQTASPFLFANEELSWIALYSHLPFHHDLWKAEARLLTDLQEARTEQDDVRADKIRFLLRGVGSRLAESYTPANVEHKIVPQIIASEKARLDLIIQSVSRQEEGEKKEMEQTFAERERDFSRAAHAVNRPLDKRATRDALEIIEDVFMEHWKELERLCGTWEKFLEVYTHPDHIKPQRPHGEDGEGFPKRSLETTIARRIAELTDVRIVRDTLIAQLLKN